VKDFFEAVGRGDKQGLLALSAEDVQWIIPGKAWPLASTHRGHAGLEDLLQKASEMEISSLTPPEYVALAICGHRVGVNGGSAVDRPSPRRALATFPPKAGSGVRFSLTKGRAAERLH
jgi:ketosteroid isomerase-like protein